MTAPVSSADPPLKMATTVKGEPCISSVSPGFFFRLPAKRSPSITSGWPSRKGRPDSNWSDWNSNESAFQPKASALTSGVRSITL